MTKADELKKYLEEKACISFAFEEPRHEVLRKFIDSKAHWPGYAYGNIKIYCDDDYKVIASPGNRWDGETTICNTMEEVLNTILPYFEEQISLF